MRFRWDSDVARDISTEMDRLGEALADCSAELEKCIGILRQMGQDPEGAIEKYAALAGTLKKDAGKLEERLAGAGRAVRQANELFETNEQALGRRAADMGSGSASGLSEAGDPGWSGTAPMFYNVPGPAATPPMGTAWQDAPAPWPMPAGIAQAVIIDHTMLTGGMAMLPWLQGLIETGRDRERINNH